MPFTKETAALPRATRADSPLQQVRLSLGLTQGQAAQALDVSMVQWQRWETGKTATPKYVWLSLKGLYGVDVSEQLSVYESR